jgi:hypothetical protein
LAIPWVQQPSARAHEAGERLHVKVDSLLPDVLDHADARDRVELLGGRVG